MDSAAPFKILYILHAFGYGGGVENHSRLLAQSLREYFQTWILYPSNGHLCLESVESEETSTIVPDDACAVEAWPASGLSRAIDRVVPDLIHIQHSLNWHPEMVEQVLSTGIPTVMSFHDYAELSSNFTLLGTPLGLSPFQAALRCGDSSETHSRLQLRRRLLAQLAARVVPSSYLREALQEAFDVDFRIVEYGIADFAVKRRAADAGSLRFGFLGSMLPQKGWQLLVDAFRPVYERYPETRLLMFGEAIEEVPENGDGVIYCGSYRADALPSILECVDVGVIPSRFRETFSIVLSEFQQAGVPVIASKLGALEHRVDDGATGMLVEPDSAEALTEAMLWFCEHAVWREWTIPHPPSAATMVSAYRALYSEILGLPFGGVSVD